MQAIDMQNGAVLASGLTDQDGRCGAGLEPCLTVLFIPSVNLFPMYWPERARSRAASRAAGSCRRRTWIRSDR